MKRFYRESFKAEDLKFFRVIEEQTDLYIGAERNLKKEASESVARVRKVIQSYIPRQPKFLSSLEPIVPLPDAPHVIRDMCDAGIKANVGPMAGIAGVVSQIVAKDLLRFSNNVIVENGGDIYIKTTVKRRIGIYAGNSPLSNRFAVNIYPEQTPCGICTSSGTIGHSLSFGRADAAVVFAKNAVVADAAATRLGNLISHPDDFDTAINTIKKISDVFGIIVILDDKIAFWGNMELC